MVRAPCLAHAILDTLLTVPNRRSAISKLAWIVMLAALAAAPAAAQTAIPDVRGTWKGESCSDAATSIMPGRDRTSRDFR